MSVTTGTLSIFASLPSDSGRTAVVPHSEYRASEYMPMMSPFLTTVLSCRISCGSLVNLRLQMHPMSLSSHSRPMNPSMATTKFTRCGNVALMATDISINALWLHKRRYGGLTPSMLTLVSLLRWMISDGWVKSHISGRRCMRMTGFFIS